MALQHEFFISTDDNMSFDDAIHKCILSDYLIHYMWDTMKWISTLSYKNVDQMGFNYDGINIIQGQGLKHFNDVLNSWYNIFSLAPTFFKLKSEYCITDETYVYQEIERESLLNEISNLIKLLQKAIKVDQKVVYFGV